MTKSRTARWPQSSSFLSALALHWCLQKECFESADLEHFRSGKEIPKTHTKLKNWLVFKALRNLTVNCDSDASIWEAQSASKRILPDPCSSRLLARCRWFGPTASSWKSKALNDRQTKTSSLPSVNCKSTEFFTASIRLWSGNILQ